MVSNKVLLRDTEFSDLYGLVQTFYRRNVEKAEEDSGCSRKATVASFFLYEWASLLEEVGKVEVDLESSLIWVLMDILREMSIEGEVAPNKENLLSFELMKKILKETDNQEIWNLLEWDRRHRYLANARSCIRRSYEQ
jgi:hypothetical protein